MGSWRRVPGLARGSALSRGCCLKSYEIATVAGCASYRKPSWLHVHVMVLQNSAWRGLLLSRVKEE